MFWIKPLKTLYINNIKVSQSFELDHCFLFWQNLSKQTAAVPFLTLPGHFSLGEHFLKFTFGSFLPISLCLPGPSHRDSSVPYLPVAMSPTLTSLGHSGTVFSHIFSLPGPSSLMQPPCTPHSLGATIPLTFKAGFKSPPHKAWSAFQSPVYPGPVLHANCLASVSWMPAIHQWSL